MKFAVRDIAEDGLDVKKTVDPDEIGLDAKDIDLQSKLDIKARVYRVDDFILADVIVTATYGTLCARCLESIDHVRSREFHFDYEVKPDLDTVDVGEDIRQEMILGISFREFCKPDCRGICKGCGMNLNLEKCKCK